VKLYMNEQEQIYMQTFHPGLWEKLENNIEVYRSDLEPIAPGLKKLAHDTLGGLAVEYGYRVAEDPEVPRVRHLGNRANLVIFDEPHNLSEVYSSGEPSFVAQKWVEHRRVCRRALLDCLSGETC
jgi:hypothetical protein